MSGTRYPRRVKTVVSHDARQSGRQVRPVARRPAGVHATLDPRPPRSAQGRCSFGSRPRAGRREEHDSSHLRRAPRPRLGGTRREGRYALGIRALRLGSRSTRAADRDRVSHRRRRVPLAATTRRSRWRCSTATSRCSSRSRRRPSRSGSSRMSARRRRPSPPRAAASAGDAPPETVARALQRAAARHADGSAAERPARAADLLERCVSGFAENMEETAIGLYAASVPVTNAAGMTLAALT